MKHTWLVIGLLLGLAAIGIARRPRSVSDQSWGDVGVARDLIGRRVSDASHTPVGRVADIVLRVETGDVRYVVVELTLPTAGKSLIERRPGYALVPWSQVETATDAGGAGLVLRTDRSTLYDSPRYAREPATSGAEWDRAIEAYWAAHSTLNVPQRGFPAAACPLAAT
jgi:sporulation protein YlmC with PRC-barrel domain